EDKLVVCSNEPMTTRTSIMTERERFIAAMRFEKPDRVPLTPGHGRRSTLRNWHKQGLPADVTDYHAYIRQLLGIEPEPKVDAVGHGLSLSMMPEFEEKVIERRPPAGPGQRGTLVVQDWKGNICEISDEFSPSDLR